MDFKIAVLAGDGIGPEISVQGVDVMNAVCEKFGHKVSYEYAICGADAIDKVGDPFPEATFQACKNADAVLFSAVGDPNFLRIASKPCSGRTFAVGSLSNLGSPTAEKSTASAFLQA